MEGKFEGFSVYFLLIIKLNTLFSQVYSKIREFYTLKSFQIYSIRVHRRSKDEDKLYHRYKLSTTILSDEHHMIYHYLIEMMVNFIFTHQETLSNYNYYHKNVSKIKFLRSCIRLRPMVLRFGIESI